MGNKFKVGDVVRLKTDNTKATIEEITDDTIKCVWFDKNHLLREGNFIETDLLYIK